MHKKTRFQRPAADNATPTAATQANPSHDRKGPALGGNLRSFVNAEPYHVEVSRSILRAVR